MKIKNNREIGTDYESIAADFLASHGIKVYKKNFRCKQGEIDLIGLHMNYLIFIEVKYRKNEKAGMPEEAVGVSKQKKISQVASYFLYSHPQFINHFIRFDVVAICGNEIRWYQDAFPYIAE